MEDHYAAIGKVAAEWTLVEILIDSTCHKLATIGDYRIGLCLTSQVIGPARKFDALFALSRLMRGEESIGKNWNAIRDEAIRLSEQRNRIVHDYWVSSPGKDPMRFHITARSRLKAEWVSVPIEQMHRTAADISAFARRLELELTKLEELPAIALPEES